MILLLTTIGGFHCSALGQEPAVLVQVDRNSIYEGESITYSVTLNNIDQPSPPDLSSFKDFDVEPAGEVNHNSQQITIINGVRTESVLRGRQYNYRLTPKTLGTLTIPPPKATSNGKTLQGKSETITVKPADSQEIVKLDMSLDKQSVYVAQPFTITLTIAVQSLPKPSNDRDPLTIQREPPMLNVPWLTDEQLPKSLKSEQNLSTLLQPLVSQRGVGFGINGYRDSGSIFRLLDSSSLGFHPKPKVTSRKNVAGESVDYWTYSFKRTFTASSPGKIQFIPATVKGIFATSISRGRLQGEEIYAKSQSAEIEVRDAPLDGRPESYVGAIGKFTLASELTPTNAHVGDPLTLTISLSGTGELADASPPNLDLVKDLKRDFKMYEGTTQTEDDSKRFTFSLRPLSSNVRVFPEIPVSYFDVEKEQYVTLKTEPIPVSISEAEKLNAASVISNGSTASNKPIDSLSQAAEGGLFANYTDLASLRDERVSLQGFMVAWIGMISFTVVAHCLIGLVRRRQADPARLRRQTALARAESLLAESSKASQATSMETVRRAIVGLIADFVGVPAHGLSTSDVDLHLERVSAPPELRVQVRKLLDDCDAARFSSTGLTTSTSPDHARGLIDRLHQVLIKSAKVFVLFVGLASLSGCVSRPDEKVTKQFLDASQQFDVARSTQDYFNVAVRFQQIIDEGFVSGAVLFNQGNAWMKAGQKGRAIACYRQALRYRPRDSSIRSNLQSTLAQVAGSSTSEKSPMAWSYLYFWRDWFSLREKLILQTVLVGSLLIGSCLIWRWTIFKSVTFGLLIPTLAVGISCMIDFHDQFQTEHGVIVGESVTVRKGNAESYEAAFSAALSEGSEFIVLERKLDWLHIDVPSVGHGWVAEDQAVVY